MESPSPLTTRFAFGRHAGLPEELASHLREEKRGEVLSLLRRELLSGMGDVDIETITLAAIVKRIDTIRTKRPGTAKELRTRAGVFFGWCASKGLLKASPLAGHWQPR